jgi:hypothetical protein
MKNPFLKRSEQVSEWEMLFLYLCSKWNGFKTMEEEEEWWKEFTGAVLVKTCFHSVCAFAAVAKCRRNRCSNPAVLKHDNKIKKFFQILVFGWRSASLYMYAFANGMQFFFHFISCILHYMLVDDPQLSMCCAIWVFSSLIIILEKTITILNWSSTFNFYSRAYTLTFEYFTRVKFLFNFFFAIK